MRVTLQAVLWGTVLFLGGLLQVAEGSFLYPWGRKKEPEVLPPSPPPPLPLSVQLDQHLTETCADERQYTLPNVEKIRTRWQQYRGEVIAKLAAPFPSFEDASSWIEEELELLHLLVAKVDACAKQRGDFGTILKSTTDDMERTSGQLREDAQRRVQGRVDDFVIDEEQVSAVNPLDMMTLLEFGGPFDVLEKAFAGERALMKLACIAALGTGDCSKEASRPSKRPDNATIEAMGAHKRLLKRLERVLAGWQDTFWGLQEANWNVHENATCNQLATARLRTIDEMISLIDRFLGEFPPLPPPVAGEQRSGFLRRKLGWLWPF